MNEFTIIALPISILALVIAGLSWGESRKSAGAATQTAKIAFKESAIRTRPWVGIRAVVAAERETDDLPDNLLILQYDNVGSLPGFGVEFSVELAPIKEPDTAAVDVTPLVFVGDPRTGIFPGERSKFRVSLPDDLGDTGRFWSWVNENLKINFSGTIRYSGPGQSGTAAYRTDFIGAMVISPAAEITVTRWANMRME